MGMVLTVARKELRETLRDWRTLLMMIGVPILLYPLLMAGAQQLAVMGMDRVAAGAPRVGLAEDAPADLRRLLGDATVVQIPAVPGDAAERIRLRELDAAVVVEEAPDTTPGRVAILFDETRDRSRHARGIAGSAIAEWSDTLLARRLRAAGLPATFASPVMTVDSSVARPAERGGYLLGRFLPLLLVTMALLGAFYPAIDLAAGEKERGTLETLLTSPVPPFQIVLGKFITVAGIGLAAATLNLASMLLTLRLGLFQLPTEAGFAVAIPPTGVLVMLLALVALASLFAALFLGIAVRSHSFKEAQNTLTPVMVVALLPAIVPILPGVEFTPALALVPVGGVTLLFRELMVGSAPLLPSVLALVASMGYAGLALAFAAAAFGREDVLFGTTSPDTAVSWRERLAAWRGARPVPEPRDAFFLLAVVFLLSFAGSAIAGRRLGLEGGLLATQWLFILAPALLFVALGRFDVRATLGLRRPSGQELAGAVLVIAGGVPLGWTLAWLQSHLLPVPEALLETLRDLATAETPGRLAWLLLLLAVTPAICEEVLFRGVLLGSSRRSMTASQAIALNAILFGAFHLSVFRFLPTAWLGVLIAWVVWHTRSLWTGMLMHLLNNGTVVVLATVLAGADWLQDARQPPPWILPPLGAVVLWLGVRLIRAAGDDGSGRGVSTLRQ
jgi:sodium transport system permease protein